SRSLGIPGANLLSVSASGELAILLKKTNVFGTVGTGTLARVPLGGGAPRQILDDVFDGDWLPDGNQLAVLRRLDPNDVLEFPAGKAIYRAPLFSLTTARVSPDGEKVALIDNSDGPALVLIDRAGKRTVLNRDWIYLDSIVWHPSGKEVWAGGVNSSPDASAGVFAIGLSGQRRAIAETTDVEILHDIAKDGRVLAEREITVREVYFGSSRENV